MSILNVPQFYGKEIVVNVSVAEVDEYDVPVFVRCIGDMCARRKNSDWYKDIISYLKNNKDKKLNKYYKFSNETFYYTYRVIRGSINRYKTEEFNYDKALVLFEKQKNRDIKSLKLKYTKTLNKYKQGEFILNNITKKYYYDEYKEKLKKIKKRKFEGINQMIRYYDYIKVKQKVLIIREQIVSYMTNSNQIKGDIFNRHVIKQIQDLFKQRSNVETFDEYTDKKVEYLVDNRSENYIDYLNKNTHINKDKLLAKFRGEFDEN